MVAIGALIGAPARYLTDRAIQSRRSGAFPWGTLTVNLIACLILGVVVGLSGHLSATLAALLGTGLCGTLSTYSTFSYETMRLYGDGARLRAVLNVALSLVGGIGAAALGWTIGMALVG